MEDCKIMDQPKPPSFVNDPSFDPIKQHYILDRSPPRIPKDSATQTDESSNQAEDIQEVPGRVCSRCDKFKPWSQYHETSSSASGHASHCKICHDKYYGKKERKCVTCKKMLPKIEFDYDNGKSQVRQCITCYQFKKEYISKISEARKQI